MIQTTNSASGNSPGTSSLTNQGIPNATNATSPALLNPSFVTNTASQVISNFIESKNVPVEFYGQVIDQDSNALAGVDVKVIVQQLIMPNSAEVDIAATNIPIEQITGTDGRFEISGVEGASFDLESIQKAGYEVESPRRGYQPIGGSFEQPVIFKMWNTNIHGQLITGDEKFSIVPDGRPYFINLTTGAINESGTGDLKVWIQYTNQIVRGQLYDWSAGIDVANGGLFEEQNLNSAMYSAPANGYVPNFELQQQIKGGQEGQIGSRRFYVVLNNGSEYGKITINLYAPFNDQIPGLIRLSYVINPSGSTILR
jgi:hypothetical protein